MAGQGGVKSTVAIGPIPSPSRVLLKDLLGTPITGCMIALLTRLTVRAVRHEVKRSAAHRSEPVQGTEEERMLAMLDPNQADAVKRRYANHIADSAPSAPLDPRARRAEVHWDTNNSVPPPG